MSSEVPQEPEIGSTPATGISRRLLGRRIGLCAAGAIVVAGSLAIGWFLQTAFRPAPAVDPAADVEAGETPPDTSTLADHTQHGDPSPDDHHPATSHTVADDVHAESEAGVTASKHEPTHGETVHVSTVDEPTANDAEPRDGDATSRDASQFSHNDRAPVREIAPSAAELARAETTGEEKFQAGKAAAALSDFDWVAKYQDRSLDDRFHYRCGVCAEALGESDRALREYGTALNSATDETLIVLCRLGQARIWRSLGNSRMAIQLLANAFLTNGNDRRAAVVRPLVAYLLVDALAAETSATPPAQLADDDGVSRPAWKFDLFERSLLRSLGNHDVHGVPIDGGVRALPSDADGDQLLQVNLPRMNVQNVFDALCRAADRRVVWTPAARVAVTGRSAEICESHASLALCLDMLTAPLEVVWTEQGNEVHVSAVDEVEPDVIRAQRLSALRRALTHAVQQYPDFVLAPHAHVLLGNLAFQDGHLDDAERHYRQVFEIAPRSVVRSDAWFNLAKLHLRCERPEPALDAFWHVIDSGAAPDCAAVASLYIGRLLLDAEEPRRAILPLTRATQWTTVRNVRARSVLCLATAYLLYGNAKSANEVLMDFRSDFEAEAQQAAFLSALARFRAAENSTRRMYEGQALLVAAHPVHPEEFFGRYGWHLCGRVYEELMLPEMAIEVYREALGVSGRLPYRDAIVFGLASCLADSGDGASAQEYFNEILLGSGPEWQRKAASRLSRLQLDMDQPLDAARTARTLLTLSTETGDKTRALQLLGEAYQRLGDHAAAALCFSGSTPADSPAAADGEP